MAQRLKNANEALTFCLKCSALAAFHKMGAPLEKAQYETRHGIAKLVLEKD